MDPTSLSPRAPAPDSVPPGLPDPPPGAPPGPLAPPAEPARAGDRRALLAVAACGVAMAAVWRTSLVAVAGSILVAALAAALVVAGRPVGRAPRLVLCAAVALGLFLCLRSSPWVIGPDLVAIALLLAVGATVTRGGRLSDVGLAAASARGIELALCAPTAPAFVGDAVVRPPATEATRAQRRARVRGAALALPAALTVVLLLAAGDAVFASILRVPSGLERVPLDLVAVVCGALVAATLLAHAARGPHRLAPSSVDPRVGRTETTWVLAAVAGPLAAFAVVQGVAAAGGAAHVLETEGLTYAEYAREGFFSLLAACAVVLTVVLSVSGGVRRARVEGHPAPFVLAEVVVVLTIGLAAVSVRRLALYEAEFGATMLRLSCTVFAVFLASVLVAAGVWVAGVGERRWLPVAVGSLALATLLGWNVADPEAVVVERNLARAAEGRALDVEYLTRLSDDGRAALDLGALPEDADVAVRLAICGAPPPEARQGLGWNRTAAAARASWFEVCDR